MSADWSGERLTEAAGRMAQAIRHRGPDGEGCWVDTTAGIGLSHRRLAIVELSPLGAQPMCSQDGRHVLVFNGEVYNFPALRVQLEDRGVHFRGRSDTEVMLEALACWGPVEACRRMAGMFAFAWWDRSTQRLVLGRDRLGKKPLYFSLGSNVVAFGSELKALRAMPGFEAQPCAEAIAEFLRFGYVGEADCILRGVRKVRPGAVVTIDRQGNLQEQRYWRLEDFAAAPRVHGLRTMGEAKRELLTILEDATKSRMLADVPLGAFLSGGIDSGLVVALMQRVGSGHTRTFSIGFEEQSHDEAPVARAVADHLGTRHTELYVTQAQAQAAVADLADIYDEPFADASQIPTTLLARLARPHVTVALTGDGGDEAFGGYLRYRNEDGVVGQLYGLPRALRLGLAAGLRGLPPGGWDALARFVPERRRPRFLASKVGKLARALELDNHQQRGREYLTLWNPAAVMRPGVFGSPSSADTFDAPMALPSSEAMQYWETLHYLPGDLLTKMDRATMSASLEARSPLLDHRVVEFAWTLHPDLKAGPIALKHLLRQALFEFVPAALVDLPKRGFSIPLGAWLRSELRDHAREMLKVARQDLGHLLQMDAIDATWHAHQSRRVDAADRLWAVVMLAQWWRRWQGGTP